MACDCEHAHECFCVSGNTLAVPRLGVPSINMQDASSGFRTIDQSIEGTVTQWPSMMALSASWDDQLTYDVSCVHSLPPSTSPSDSLLPVIR